MGCGFGCTVPIIVNSVCRKLLPLSSLSYSGLHPCVSQMLNDSSWGGQASLQLLLFIFVTFCLFIIFGDSLRLNSSSARLSILQLDSSFVNKVKSIINQF